MGFHQISFVLWKLKMRWSLITLMYINTCLMLKPCIPIILNMISIRVNTISFQSCLTNRKYKTMTTFIRQLGFWTNLKMSLMIGNKSNICKENIIILQFIIRMNFILGLLILTTLSPIMKLLQTLKWKCSLQLKKN